MGHATPLRVVVPPGRAALVAGVATAVVALGTTAAALGYGDGVAQDVVPGLRDAGALTGWGLPLARLAGDLAAALVAGNALAAAFWSRPGSEPAARHTRFAARSAAVWAVAAVVTWLLTVSDELGRPVTGIFTPDALGSVGLGTSSGRSRAVVVVAAVAAALVVRATPAAALVAALAGVAPAAFVDQEVSVADSRLAAGSLLFHGVALALWTGTLGALLLRVRAAGDDLQHTAERYARLALVCLCAASASGALHAVLVLNPSDTGLGSGYGRLVVVELAALGVLAAIGWWHRTQTIPAIGRGLRAPFVRFAVLELTVLGAVAGLTVALARTPAPLDSGADLAHHPSAGVSMLGFDLPSTVSFAQLALDWRPDPVWLVLCVAAVLGYLRLESRAHRAGVVWPARRGTAWLAGVAVVAVATSSGVGRYTPVFFSVAMIQHLLLAVVAPLLLVRAAPVTLAVRALPTGPDQAGAWLRTALRAPAARIVTAPPAVVALWAAGPFGLYFTGVFDAARWSYAVDLLVTGYLLGSGVLLAWWVTGADPRPGGRRSDRDRTAVAILAVGAAAAAGLLLAVTSWVVAPDWYAGLQRVLVISWPWGSTGLRADQAVGGTLLWVVSTLAGVAMLGERAVAQFGRRPRHSEKHERPGPAAR